MLQSAALQNVYAQNRRGGSCCALFSYIFFETVDCRSMIYCQSRSFELDLATRIGADARGFNVYMYKTAMSMYKTAMELGRESL